MPLSPLQKALHQAKPFPSLEAEVFVALQVAANRAVDGWARYLRANSDLTVNQYNVLRILRGAHPGSLTCNEIADRTIERDPDITRLIDRLAKREFVARARDTRDRRIVRNAITDAGLAELERLDRPSATLSLGLLRPLGAERLEQLSALLSAVIQRGEDFQSDMGESR